MERMEFTIRLNAIDKVKNFVNEITKIDANFDLVSDRYVVDAKSIMGIFSLDLCKTLKLIAYANDEKALDGLEEKLKMYVVKEENA